MVNTPEEYRKFLETNKFDDLFVHIIFSDDKVHPVVSSPTLLIVFNLKTDAMFHLSLGHQDAPVTVDKETILSDFKLFTGRIFVWDKKSFLHHFDLPSVLDVELLLHLNMCKLDKFPTTQAHDYILKNNAGYSNLNNVIPLMKHRECVRLLIRAIRKLTSGKFTTYVDDAFLRINSEIIEPLSRIERNGICVDVIKFQESFNVQVDGGFVYSQYNLNTSTGRPSNRFGGINYAALNKDDGTRDCFISRHGLDGTLMMIDYSAFHPRIIGELTHFPIKPNVDFYDYIGKLMFHKPELTGDDVDLAKKQTFRQLYGGVEEEYENIQYFYNLKSFINKNWDKFQADGFVETPVFRKKIHRESMVDANPNKLFSYILQAVETEIAVPVLTRVFSGLEGKRSVPVLYTYDSLLFDVYLPEYEFIKENIIPIMESNNRFPVKCYVGKSYGSMKRLIV